MPTLRDMLSEQDAVAAKVDGALLDLAAEADEGAEVRPVLPGDPEGLEVMRHSASHVMAEAVLRLREGALLAIGPATSEGFYYDFDLEEPLGEDDLPKIEEEMRAIVAEDRPFERIEISRGEAIAKAEADGQLYKQEILREMPDETVSIYRAGGFEDLCRGPHVPSTGRIGAFKVLSVAGSYWRGDERRKMLQRVYGTCFATQEGLDRHLELIEEAKKRDHRVLGKQLDLFSMHREVGAGLVHWHPKGAVIRNEIETFWKEEHRRRGYDLVYTPHIASEEIYRQSGHLENYADSMYSPMDIDGRPYRAKPMNCPNHIMIYNSRRRSYRELPIRYAELGTVYRYEPTGTLHGMLRVRGFTQDDSHIFCTADQLAGEIEGVLDIVDFMMATFGYESEVYLATRPEKYLGTEEVWEQATGAMREALERRGTPYEIDEGGGVFYAPKIDVKLLDALGRAWQGPTIQVDLNLPERFDVDYVGSDGAEHRVMMIHRTVLGSMERFVGGLVEHYGGAFPVWMAPVQVIVAPITDAQEEYAAEVQRRLQADGIRARLDARREKISHKIREAEIDKVPYFLVIGKREVEAETVAVRRRGEGDTGAVPLEEFHDRVVREARERTS